LLLCINHNCYLYCCCVSIIIVICICPPGVLIWLINLFYSILFYRHTRAGKEIYAHKRTYTYSHIYGGMRENIYIFIRWFITNLQETPWVDAKRNKVLLVSSADRPCWCINHNCYLYCCCVSIIIVICICPPGALIWLINLFYSI
jgi:hypothetical protein